MNTQEQHEVHVVLGTGPVGLTLTDELLARGMQVRLVNRRGKATVPAGVELVAADITDIDTAKEVCRGAAVVYNCTNAPSYAEQVAVVPPIVQQWAAAWNTGNAAGMAGLFTLDGIYDDHAFQARSQGAEAIGAFVKITTQHIPGAHCEVIDAFEAGDRLAVQWVFSGTPGAFGDAPATGKPFAVPVVTIFEMQGSKIRHGSDYYNLADLFRQVGLPAGPWVPLAP